VDVTAATFKYVDLSWNTQMSDTADLMREQVDTDVIPLVAVAILRDGKVLVVEEKAEPYHGQWVIPQGYIRNNETTVEAARREVREELGIEVEIVGLVGVYDDFVKEKGRTVHFVIICYAGNQPGRGEVYPTREVINSAWKDPSEEFGNAPQVVQRILTDVSTLSKRGGRTQFSKIWNRLRID
jgi:8-oxo-dGTP diphosphatase